MKKIIKHLWPIFFLAMILSGSALSPDDQEKSSARINPRQFTASLIGHAHIDLSWLWLWEETVHEVGPMTFWGTLRQMNRMPGLTFAQSQAAIYEATEKNYPDLFQEIGKKVKEGTWIPVGGMWVEADLNMPDGESLARQLLYGKRYFLDKFGVEVRAGWNPDSFGHNWQLPQILKKAGIDYYVFERCAPEKTIIFWWEGLDGSRLLAYVPPGWYLVNLKNGVRDLLLRSYENAPIRDFMLLYGAGDHGGGPRDTDVEAILKFRNEPGHPRLEFVNPENYFRQIEKLKARYPVVKRELNFAFPGCYTTQVETKKFNRRLENLLLEAELVFNRPVKRIRILDSSGAEIPSQMLLVDEESGQLKAKVIFIAERVPSLGFKTYRVIESKAAPKYKTSLVVSKKSIENEFLKLALGPKTGWWKSLMDKKNGREFLSAAGNVLEAVADEPPNMSAWEMELKEIQERLGERGASVKVLEKGPVRATVRVEHNFRNSKLVQDIQLYAGVPRVEVRVWMEWQERNIIIKSSFPAALKDPVATFEIPYGAISRPAVGNEVPAIKWIDLTDSQGQAGLSLLNDSRYGFDVKDNVMRMSLIRGATYPDPEADRGKHELAYALYPHSGTWKEGLSFRRAMEFNSQLRAHQALIHPGSLEPAKSFFRISPENVVLTAFKKETGYGSSGFVVRMYEVCGREAEVRLELPKEMEVYEADLIERPGARVGLKTKAITLRVKPYEIKTLLLR